MPPLQTRVPRTQPKNVTMRQTAHGGVKTPPYRPAQTGNEPRTPRGAHPCREAYMPPLQTPGIASMTSETGSGGRFAGRIHAAPTNRPGTTGKQAKEATQ